MKRNRLYDITAIVGLILHLLGSATQEPKLTPRERAQVPPPRLKYRVITTNMQEMAEARWVSTNTPSLKVPKQNNRFHHPGR